MLPAALMIGQTVSHYRVTAELGAGGMGVVYLAEDRRLGRRVAIKFLPDSAAANAQALDRFRREARAASALNHRHICTIHDIDEHGGRPFIVMEALEGETLHARIARKPFDLDGLLDVAMQVAEGLEAAHAKGIVHRDIKPSNIFRRRQKHRASARLPATSPTRPMRVSLYRMPTTRSTRDASRPMTAGCSSKRRV